MKFQGKKHIFFILLASVVTLISYFLFIQTPLFQEFSEWSRQNFLLFITTLLIIKVVGIVWPPIPGGLLTLGAIPIIGWGNAYIIDFIGSTLGSSAGFLLGQRYGLNLLHRIFDQSTIEKIQRFKIIKSKEIEAVFVMRVLTGSTVSEAVCYGAGFIGVKFQHFLIGSVLAHIVVGIPSYYFAGNILEGKNLLLNALFVLIAIPLLLKLKGRYIE